jgi:hypothetical protein
MRWHVPTLNVVRRSVERSLGGEGYSSNPLFHFFLRLSRPNPYLRRNRKHKCIFIHIPRTAGTSIANALFDDGDRGHTPAYAYRAFDPDRFTSYFKFAFVRNPYSRLVSSYHQVRRNAHNPRVSQWASKYLDNLNGFSDFLERLDENQSFRRIVLALDHFRPQHEFVTCDGELELDFIGRFENLNADFQNVASTLNLDASLPYKNT